ncbi:hypothetical protein [Burkholderia pseudomallei]|uniref:hypothetical protein n=1 Tax=Burkholderia pseudomallei TaxID=28450 RepID=UPI0019402A46|nr:hypothetical protein [Burkholderia pseudomallei]
MPRKLKELQEKGHPVDTEVLRVLSAYRGGHINCLCNILQRLMPSSDSAADFLR